MEISLFVIYISIVLGLCWGSFLNVIAFRLLCGSSPLTGRSKCPSCDKQLAWYDLVPVFSWIYLQGKCRTCKAKISWLYPFIEIITGLTFVGIALFVPPHHWLATCFYASALIITIRTDITDLIIMRQTTIFLIPLAFMASYFSLIPITITKSLLGSIVGAGTLALFSSVFWLITKKVGIGQGDIELCGLIGAVTGILGWWFALIVASFLGTIIGIIALITSSKKTNLHQIKIPFGAFLAIGSLIFSVFQNDLHLLFTKFLLAV